MTRTYTFSEYDHVAMVLKYDNDSDEIYFVEAVGKVGVALNRWSNLRRHIGCNKFYRKVIFRHINFDRSDEMLDNLDTFLNEAIGKKYNFNLFNSMRT